LEVIGELIPIFPSPGSAKEIKGGTPQKGASWLYAAGVGSIN
jgi:hypothetical protein